VARTREIENEGTPADEFLQRAEVLTPDLGTIPRYARVRFSLKAAGTR